MGANGGAYSERDFTYDSRSNRLTMNINPSGDMYTSTFSGAAQLPDQLIRVERSSLPGNANWNTFAYDRDGRVVQKAWPGDSGGSSASDIYANYAWDNAIGPGADTVFRGVCVSGTCYNYWYDSQNRRRRKDYPNGATDEYFYDQRHSMLEDRWNSSFFGYALDEYVWLGGLPVALYRSAFDPAWQRQPDGTGTCTRNGQSSACGLYFVVTDHIGKPVLMLDAARRITGVGEYDVSGHVNRVQAWGASPSGETSHPYANQTNSVIADFTQPTHTMAISVRTHFTQMDTEVWNGVTMDWARIENGDTGAVLGGNMGGPHKGDYWSSSVAAPSTGHLKVRFASSLGNCAPWDVYPACTQGFQYSGVALREYEYQRSSATRWGSDTSWRHSLTPGNGWEQPSYNDESWPLATDEGAYGTYPWYTAAPFPAGTPSHWIWYYDSRSSGDKSTVYFRRRFTAGGGSSTFTFTADDNFVAYLNGVQIASGNWWPTPQTIVQNLTAGAPYVLAVAVTNGGGPGGLIVDVNEPAVPAWVPIRFPGQYYDAETDWFENWNRYYDPGVGRYLSPEPMLQSPEYVHSMAGSGMSVSTYAYAANNPLRYTDATGLFVTHDKQSLCPNWDAALKIAQEKSGCSGKAVSCECAAALKCDICPMLVEGQGPDAFFRFLGYSSSGGWIAGHTTIAVGWPIRVRSVEFDPFLCNFEGSAFVEGLASVIIHEASEHACSEDLNTYLRGHPKKSADKACMPGAL